MTEEQYWEYILSKVVLVCLVSGHRSQCNVCSISCPRSQWNSKLWSVKRCSHEHAKNSAVCLSDITAVYIKLYWAYITWISAVSWRLANSRLKETAEVLAILSLHIFAFRCSTYLRQVSSRHSIWGNIYVAVNSLFQLIFVFPLFKIH